MDWAFGLFPRWRQTHHFAIGESVLVCWDSQIGTWLWQEARIQTCCMGDARIRTRRQRTNRTGTRRWWHRGIGNRGRRDGRIGTRFRLSGKIKLGSGWSVKLEPDVGETDGSDSEGLHCPNVVLLVLGIATNQASAPCGDRNPSLGGWTDQKLVPMEWTDQTSALLG